MERMVLKAFKELKGFRVLKVFREPKENRVLQV